MIRTKPTQASKQISGINITPFTDVVLVLLIIFMVTAAAMAKREMGFNITLPKANDAAVLPASPVIVRIEQGPKLFVGAKEVTFATMRRVIEHDVATSQAKRQLIIEADENTPYQLVIKTIDIAGQAGISDTLLATQKPDKAPPKPITP